MLETLTYPRLPFTDVPQAIQKTGKIDFATVIYFGKFRVHSYVSANIFYKLIAPTGHKWSLRPSRALRMTNKCRV